MSGWVQKKYAGWDCAKDDYVYNFVDNMNEATLTNDINVAIKIKEEIEKENKYFHPDMNIEIFQLSKVDIKSSIKNPG
jgi:ABC-type proline/glycine betaine transport system ATPase subunit